MTEHEIEKLATIVAEVIERHREEPRISPAWVATEVMLKLDPQRVSPPLVHAGCHLELRQLARAELRKRFEDDDDDDDDLHPEAQHELFPGLQARYPTARSSRSKDPVYVRLEYLTAVDVGYNIARLRSEANAKLKHADRLQTWWKRQQAQA